MNESKDPRVIGQIIARQREYYFSGATRSLDFRRQALNRLKHSREYKYVRCPKCHSWLKLPRKVGEVTVTCGKCRHAFKQKA